jgi:hypothetical protein
VSPPGSRGKMECMTVSVDAARKNEKRVVGLALEAAAAAAAGAREPKRTHQPNLDDPLHFHFSSPPHGP